MSSVPQWHSITFVASDRSATQLVGFVADLELPNRPNCRLTSFVFVNCPGLLFYFDLKYCEISEFTGSKQTESEFEAAINILAASGAVR